MISQTLENNENSYEDFTTIISSEINSNQKKH